MFEQLCNLVCRWQEKGKLSDLAERGLIGRFGQGVLPFVASRFTMALQYLENAISCLSPLFCRVASGRRARILPPCWIALQK